MILNKALASWLDVIPATGKLFLVLHCLSTKLMDCCLRLEHGFSLHGLLMCHLHCSIYNTAYNICSYEVPFNEIKEDKKVDSV